MITDVSTDWETRDKNTPIKIHIIGSIKNFLNFFKLEV